MKKIAVTIDQYLVRPTEQKELLALVEQAKVPSEVQLSDTHKDQGIPTDLIFTVIGLSAAGFFAALGEDGYKKLKTLLGKLFRQKKAGIRKSYFSFQVEGIVLHFEIGPLTPTNLDRALTKLSSSYASLRREVKRLLDFKPERLTGKFKSITFVYDDRQNRWVISQFNR